MTKAWWFEPANGVLGYEDNRKPIAARTHRVSGRKLELCEFGLHGSKEPLDALSYAQSNIIWWVELSGEILHGSDKSCATERTYLWKLNAETVLRKFARMCALDVMHLWDAPDVVVRYLKTGDESLRDSARAAAWDAAEAAQGAARAASWTASWAAGAVQNAAGATRAAAWNDAGAARAAIWAAAWNDAEAAVWDAEEAAEAARATEAARAAAREKHNRRLHRMLMETRV